MESKRWNTFVEYVTSTYGITKEILDYIAVNDILLCCATGLSNSTIANKYSNNTNYIKDVLNEFLNFSGWEYDLDINTYYVYDTAGENPDSFKMMINLLTPLLNDDEIEKAFNICKKYKEIKKRIDEYYE